MKITVKAIFILLCIWAVNHTALAQYKTKVKFKNGTEIKGRIISNDDNEVIVETKDKKEWKYAADDVLEITNYKKLHYLDRGFVNMTSFGLSIGRTQLNDAWWIEDQDKKTMFGFSAQTFNGYQFNQRVALGASVNFDAYLTGIADVHLPIAAAGRYFFGKKYRFFVAVDAGKSISLSDNNEFRSYSTKGGLFIQSALGIRLPSKNPNGLFLQTGFKKQKLTQKENSWWGTSTEREMAYNRWFFSIGTFI